MNNYKISVIIPIYNQEILLERSINSVMNQSIGFENIELILIDDYSTDGTKKIIKEYAKKYNNIKGIFLKENSGGPAKPRNTGIKNSTGKYLMFLDPDDFYLKDACKVLYQQIEKEEVDHVRANLILSFNDNFYKKQYDNKEYINNSLSNRNWVGCNEDITKREFILKNNINFSEELQICDDLVYGVTLCLNAKEIKYVNDCYVKVYFSDNSQSITHENYLKIINDRIKAFKITYNLENQYNKEYEQEFINKMLDLQMIDIIGEMLRSNLSHDDQMKILNEIYQLINDCINFNADLKIKWAKIIYRYISKKQFKKVIFLSNLCNLVFEKNFFIKHFRNRNYIKLSKEEIESLNMSNI